MNDLKDLIGKVVTAKIGEDEKGDNIEIQCKVIQLKTDFFYFLEKGEPVYITVNVEPIGEMPKGIDEDDLSNISLFNITNSKK